LICSKSALTLLRLCFARNESAFSAYSSVSWTQDFYIRALDVRTEKKFWRGRLPAGAEATPMTYISPKSGRQFVVIGAGGNWATTQKGDYVVSYALPE
jgi:quinate dehydrogenase (quinone)